MNKGFFVKMLAAGALLAGMAQAAHISLTSTQLFKGDTSWQNIAGAFYDDAVYGNGNGVIELGEKIQFGVTMDKVWQGDHDYDAMKIWMGNEVIGGPASSDPFNDSRNLQDQTDYKYIMDRTGLSKWYDWSNYTVENPAALYAGDPVTFTFDYTFDAIGTYDFTASVICSEDLSALVGQVRDDNVSVRDWANWTKGLEDITYWENGKKLTKERQGETEMFHVTVSTNVPEPSLISLLGFGLLSLVVVRRRK